MNTTNLKKYAPQARRDFMAAVSQRLNQFGIHADGKGKLTISTPVISGSMMQIEGMSFDAGLARAREKLVQRAEQMGFEQLVEQMAYTWFNRLSAIRFMELHGYLDHNLRVLSHPEKANSFEILDHAQDVAADLGLDRNHIVELKLAGNNDEELYRTLLLGQCHQLHQAMPFLFEALDDETELLLPDNLTRTDSILRGLVDSIPEDDWQQVEIIGWLYQFYISEKKDQVIGSVVKSEDIPAATQLFTPNWIVKYLVQNSVGRQWLMTYPDSGLKARMEYYIEPAEQEPSVIEALAAITPTSIDPETLKVLDPACGSGHILVEAYDILKAIYEERGYRVRDIPKLILEKNLYGLDIDDRAAQLAGFALLMKARADDRRIFTRDIKLNVLAIQSTQNLDLRDLWRKLALNQDAKRGSMESIFDDVQKHLGDTVDDIEFKQLRSILALFEQAKTLGSLIQVPHEKAEYLQSLTNRLQELAEQGDSMQKLASTALLPYVQQAWLLAEQYDAVVANPPFINSRNFSSELLSYIQETHPGSDMDLFTSFYIRSISVCKRHGYTGLVTPFTWMYLSTYKSFREIILSRFYIENIVKLEYNSFESACVPVCAFISKNIKISNHKGFLIDLQDFKGVENQPIYFLESKKPNCNYKHKFDLEDVSKIPENIFALSLSERALKALQEGKTIGKYADPRQGLKTGDNDKFLRRWFEVSFSKMGSEFNPDNFFNKKWFPIQKGGRLRRWFGNNEFVINWEHDGHEIKNFFNENGKLRSRPQNLSYAFRKGLTWSTLTVADFSMRLSPQGFMSESAGSICYPKDEKTIFYLLGYFCSNAFKSIIRSMSPVLSYSEGAIDRSPIIFERENEVNNLANEAIVISKNDWDRKETSWDFLGLLWYFDKKLKNCESFFKAFIELCQTEFEKLSEIENNINDIFDDIFEQKTNFQSDRYGQQPNIEVPDFNQMAIRLVSYAIGCMMGRYSLDEPGLIYAHAGNVDFDPSRYPSFPVDEDGILPLTDQDWFKDDATNRFREFLVAVWGEVALQQNLEFVAESLTLSSFKAKKGETSLDTMRRYLSNQFYKDHLQTYKKRPIYWLFSSGKQKAFECLVYLHRYNESTLARMRTEYVTPLLGKYSAYADQLNQQLQDASSSESTRIKKEQQTLEKKQAELRQFDDKLKHYADMRIKLDLDDGVKVNYGKFGDLLAEVKAVTGGSGD